MVNRVPIFRSFMLLPALAAFLVAGPALGQIKFAAFGDIGNGAGAAAVAKLTRNQNVAFDLMLGDLCYGSTAIAKQIDSNYALEKANKKLWPALGNHEFTDGCGGGSSAQGYLSYFSLPGNERYYDFTRGPVHVFVVNSHKEPDGKTPSSIQGQWLKKRLAASTLPWKIVMFHHPPYSSGEHGSTSGMRWPFEAWGASAVLSAHDHDYERVMTDANGDGVKMPYFVSGLGGHGRRPFGSIVAGSAKRYNSGDGALIVTATDTSLTFEFRNTGGTLIDKYAMTKSASAKTTTAFEFREPPQ